MSDLYSPFDVVGKTLIARKNLPVYRYSNDKQEPVGYVAKGQPAGVVFSWISPDPLRGVDKLYWQFYNDRNEPYYIPHADDAFSLSDLRQQGVISTKEKIEKEQEENRPWYEKLIREYGPWVVGTVIAVAAVRGYFSRPTSNK